MKSIHELIGIIKGINFDGIINEKEVDHLQLWVNKNRNLAYESDHINLIRMVDRALEDKIITSEEKMMLIALSKRIVSIHSEELTKVYELNGIIEDIICDGIINKDEVLRLKAWMDNYGDYVRGHKSCKEICTVIDEVLSDNVITEEEKEKLLKLLENRINFAQVETKITSLKEQVKEKKNIGIELIDLLDNYEVMNTIHARAENELKRLLSSYTGCTSFDSEIVFISLVLIAMIHYNGNYYESVRNTYKNLYNCYSEQKIEGEIRTILSRYRLNKEKSSERSRVINIALENAIVPTKFLDSFFEFIYDIYKLNFNYDIPSDLYDEFSFVYDGLKNSMLAESDDLEIKVTKKTYKLIKSTKQLIADSSNIDSVIKLSIIVAKLIDKKIWNKDVCILNPYLKYGYEKWEKTLTREEKHIDGKRIVSEFRSRWEPKYMFSQNKVYLIPPIHRIKSIYNYYDIKVVVKNDEEIIYSNDRPDIREIIGGYQVNVNKMELSKPIGKIKYQLLAGEEVIYESKDKLHRKFIVFEQNGSEVYNNTEHSGTTVFCIKNEHDRIKTFFRAEDYLLASMNVQAGDAVIVENAVFNFSSFVKPGVFGDFNVKCFVSPFENKKNIPVFQNAKLFMFECSKNIKNFEIIIDGTRKRISDFKVKITEKEVSNKYVVYLENVDNGIHTLIVNSLENGEHYNLLNAEFAVDKDLNTEVKKMNDSQYILSVESAFISPKITMSLNVENFDERCIQFIYNGKKYNYYIPFSMSIYRVDNKWAPTTQDMWIEDVQNDSILEIYGHEYDELTVSASTGEILEENIPFKQNGIVRQVHIGFMVSYKAAYDFVNVWLIKDGKLKDTLRCYNKCIWDEKTTDIYYDSVRKQLIVTPGYFGKGNIYFEISDKLGCPIYKSGILQNHVSEAVSNLPSFNKYLISFYEKPKTLSLSKANALKNYSYTFYDRDEFVGRSFKIKEVFYYQYFIDIPEGKTHRFNYTYLKFVEQIEQNKFMGELYATTLNGVFRHTRLNPVEVEICGDIIDDTIELSLSKDGDGLLLDFKHHGILNDLDDGSAVDIFSYILDLNEVG